MSDRLCAVCKKLKNIALHLTLQVIIDYTYTTSWHCIQTLQLKLEAIECINTSFKRRKWCIRFSSSFDSTNPSLRTKSVICSLDHGSKTTSSTAFSGEEECSISSSNVSTDDVLSCWRTWVCLLVTDAAWYLSCNWTEFFSPTVENVKWYHPVLKMQPSSCKTFSRVSCRK